MAPLITAIIPNFNHALVIPECLRALMRQTEENFRVIVIDDASTDNSCEVISSIIAHDNRFSLIKKNQNSGVIAVLNQGIEASASPYVYLGAADDVVSPKLFERLLESLTQFPYTSFAVCEVKLINENKKNSVQKRPFIRPSNSLRAFYPDEVSKLLKKADNWTLTGAALIKRADLLEANLLKSNLGSSADGFLLRKLALQKGFVFVPYYGLTWNRSFEGYSATTLLNEEIFNHQLATYRTELNNDESFPDWYFDKYQRRMIFSRKMFLIQSKTAFVRVLSGIAYFLAYRPFSVIMVVVTFYGRKIKREHREENQK
jgi:glycosyltransferase involved in cell wall biosynthesis